MKIFAIQEKTNKVNIVGYLFYYEKAKEFRIELLDGLDEWNIPLILSSLYKKGIRSVDSYWSKTWVEARIIPSDRQNIGQILKDNRLNSYDELDLLVLANGRCEQDEYYVAEISENELPEEISERNKLRISNIETLKSSKIIVSFENNVVKECDLTEYLNSRPGYEILKNDSKDFYLSDIQTAGYGVSWPNNLSIRNDELYEMGDTLPITSSEFREAIASNIISTQEAMKILNCSRQYISELVKNKVLFPLKVLGKNTLFLKSDVIKLGWK